MRYGIISLLSVLFLLAALTAPVMERGPGVPAKARPELLSTSNTQGQNNVH